MEGMKKDQMKDQKSISSIESQNLELKKELDGVFAGLIKEKDINESKYKKWTKSLLMLAYYEKNNKHYAEKYLRVLKKEYEKDNMKKKMINKLQSRFNTDKKLESKEIYYNLLNCNIKEVEELIPVEEVKELTETKEIEVINLKPVEEKPVLDVNKIKFVEKRDYLIKEVFAREIIELEQRIYLELENPSRSRQAIKAWDRLQVIIEKPVTDQKYFMMIYNILIKLKNAGEISFDTQKVKKYLPTDKI